ncbi:transcriptional regulator NrdR [bacterium Unc6]|nr:transcriptional regulator NrdR [bacterium Unc6]
MKCPFCNSIEDRVIDSRTSQDGESIRRRRECLKCEKRFTTYEQIENIPLMVIKKDGRREPFNRNKTIAGLIKACEKRPISTDKITQIVDRLERKLQRKNGKEVNTKKIGEFLMKKLHTLDEVAYVRFASVYRQFRDATQFITETKDFIKKTKGGKI